jgi:putative membrane protein
MLGLILVWFISAAALLLTSKLVKGFEIKDFSSAMIASLMIGFLNMILRPILLLLTLPLNILTLGLFTFIVNAIVLKSAAGILKGFNIKTWGDAILGAVVLAFVQLLIEFVLPY